MSRGPTPRCTRPSVACAARSGRGRTPPAFGFGRKGRRTLRLLPIPIGALLDWATAIAALFAALLFLNYADTHWSTHARPFVRTSLSFVLYYTLIGFMTATRTEAAALWWIRFLLPALLVQMAGLVEAALALAGARIPRAYGVLYLVGVAGLLFFALPATLHWDTVKLAPDGYFAVRGGRWAVASRAVLLSLASAAIAIIAVGPLRRHATKGKLWAFVAVTSLGVVAGLNDHIWSRTHVTPYPTSWIVAVLALAALGYALHLEVQRTYASLHTDAATGAASRADSDLRGAAFLRSEPLGVVVCDVDDFKLVNDRYGHATGDEVLRAVVRCLRAGAGETGVVARTGGDEFVILVPGCPRGEMTAVVDRVRIALTTGVPDPAPIVPSVSLGAAWSDRGSAYLDLVARADEAMYRAKWQARASLGGGDR